MCNENYLVAIPVVNGLLPDSDLLQQFRDEIESDLTRLNPDSAPPPTTHARQCPRTADGVGWVYKLTEASVVLDSGRNSLFQSNAQKGCHTRRDYIQLQYSCESGLLTSNTALFFFLRESYRDMALNLWVSEKARASRGGLARSQVRVLCCECSLPSGAGSCCPLSFSTF